jgi:hypothetical protein
MFSGLYPYLGIRCHLREPFVVPAARPSVTMPALRADRSRVASHPAPSTPGCGLARDMRNSATGLPPFSSFGNKVSPYRLPPFRTSRSALHPHRVTHTIAGESEERAGFFEGERRPSWANKNQSSVSRKDPPTGTVLRRAVLANAANGVFEHGGYEHTSGVAGRCGDSWAGGITWGWNAPCMASSTTRSTVSAMCPLQERSDAGSSRTNRTTSMRFARPTAHACCAL